MLALVLLVTANQFVLIAVSVCVDSELSGAYAYALAGTMVWEVWPVFGDDSGYECAHALSQMLADIPAFIPTACSFMRHRMTSMLASPPKPTRASALAHPLGKVGAPIKPLTAASGKAY